ncbi:Scr1 family TA system antitoxin-like transcriptional regulator [Streptomyces sp. NPDC000351]|uniref:Scr1 family TA system antitoxin-like transcriptional regulator n=1 Tax=Streptomyces sp. NPDC000351 TaxID=3154250 RepID=UPI0033251EB6
MPGLGRGADAGGRGQAGVGGVGGAGVGLRRRRLHRVHPPTRLGRPRSSRSWGSATRAQLFHILELSEQGNVTVRVIPYASPHFPGNGRPFDYAAGPVPQLHTVQLACSPSPGASPPRAPTVRTASR